MSGSFGERVRALRTKKDMTLEELAKEIGSSKSYVWELENKPNIRPSAETTYKLSLALGVTTEDLLGKVPEDQKEEQIDQVFFRDYKGLKPKTKKNLRNILDALKKGE